MAGSHFTWNREARQTQLKLAAKIRADFEAYRSKRIRWLMFGGALYRFWRLSDRRKAEAHEARRRWHEQAAEPDRKPVRTSVSLPAELVDGLRAEGCHQSLHTQAEAALLDLMAHGRAEDREAGMHWSTGGMVAMNRLSDWDQGIDDQFLAVMSQLFDEVPATIEDAPQEPAWIARPKAGGSSVERTEKEGAKREPVSRSDPHATISALLSRCSHDFVEALAQALADELSRGESASDEDLEHPRTFDVRFGTFSVTDSKPAVGATIPRQNRGTVCDGAMAENLFLRKRLKVSIVPEGQEKPIEATAESVNVVLTRRGAELRLRLIQHDAGLEQVAALSNATATIHVQVLGELE